MALAIGRVFANPQGAVDERQQPAYCYAGIEAENPAAGLPLCIHAFTVEAVRTVTLDADAVRTLSLAAESVRTVSISVEICDMSNFIKPGTAVTISLQVRTKATDALVNPTTLDLTITLPDENGTEVEKDISDFTNPSAGLFSLVYRVPNNCPGGEINLAAQADDDDDLVCVFNDTSFTVIARRLEAA